VKTLTPLVLLVACIGCSTDLGEGDPDAAREVVYDQRGVPAYAGQALIIESCGAGGFCHASGIEPAERYGAPAHLDFDLTLATTTVEPAVEETQRLADDQRRILAMKGAVWEQVVSGLMPPGGEVGRIYHEAVGPDGLDVRYDRVADDGRTFTDLPGLDTEEGREILRNWLAAGAPVIERTRVHVDGETTGDTSRVCGRTCVDTGWESIYTQIIRPSCALSVCHDHEDPQGGLDLLGEASLSDPATAAGAAAVRARLLEADVTTHQCVEMGQTTMLTPGQPNRSLFYTKLDPPSEDELCGARMPAAGSPLSDQELCVVRAWIECGACDEAPDDTATPSDPPTCGQCLHAARERCGVAGAFHPDAGSATCAEAPTCSNVLDPPSAD